jgi:predicted metal-dependent phosphoesterase TrpH
MKNLSMKNSTMKKYDIHIHSYYSPCSRNRPEDILKAAKKSGLNGIAITDHHSLKAYSILKKLNKDKNFEIIPGEEITTEYGDVLALYITKEIKSRKLLEVLKEIHAQGGISIIPHPYRPMPWTKLRFPLEKLKGKIDAIEVVNSRNTISANNKAKKMAETLKISETGSSDAHTIFDIGKAYTLFDKKEKTLRNALKNHATFGEGTTKYGLLSILAATINKRILYRFKGFRHV